MNSGLGLLDDLKIRNAQGVSLDKEGGKIILKSEVLFPIGQAELTESGQSNLRKISASLIEVLNKPSFRSQVEGVMIEGHTSQAGPFRKNLELSAQRAMHTLQFLLDSVVHSPRCAQMSLSPFVTAI